MHWFYGILLMVIILYFIFKKLPEPPKADETKSKREVSNTSKSKKKKNKKSKAKVQQSQVQAKLNQKIQKKNTPPKAKSNELDENEWPSLEKINEDKKAAAKAAAEKQKEKKNNKKNEDFNITHYEEQISEGGEEEEEEEEEYVRKSSDKPVVIQNVSLPITNRRYKKHIVQENQKYISSDDEEISDREVKVVRVVEKHEDVENIELPPEVDGWKNVVPKKANVLVIKSSSNPTPVVMKSYYKKPKEEPLTKKQKENKKKAEKKKLEKQRERELQEERLRRHRLEQQRLNIGYKYVPPPKPHNTVKSSSKTPAPAPVIFSSSTTTTSSNNNNNKNNNNKNSKNNKKEDEWISTTVPANGITSLWGN